MNVAEIGAEVVSIKDGEKPVEIDENEIHRGDFHRQWKHVERSVLIRATQNYIVVLDLKEHIDWETRPIYDAEIDKWPEESRLAHNNLLAEIAVLEVGINEDFPSGIKRHFRRLLGEALTYSFEKDPLTAKKIVEAAIQYWNARSEETSRRWYLSSSAICSGFFVLLGFMLWIDRLTYISRFGETVFWLLLSSCAGALGTLLSVIVRSGDLKVDADAGKSLHWLEAGSRVIAGAISAVVVVLAIRSDMIFGNFSANGHMNLFTFLASIAAGSGERLATSIISKFDDKSSSTKSKSSSTSPKE
ncbi:hypothetical protein [Herbaspirillum lusitanum]|uniref:hypothetical protein n=1 Tax=Herbaspirillum lusitanum TaxID=213312 RepID=UPI0012F4A441|nr:hypothetical protein [Herbaspirillum lusitanum]